VKAYERAYYQQNKEKFRQYQRAYRQRNKEKLLSEIYEYERFGKVNLNNEDHEKHITIMDAVYTEKKRTLKQAREDTTFLQTLLKSIKSEEETEEEWWLNF
jgi:hypothetical protein